MPVPIPTASPISLIDSDDSRFLPSSLSPRTLDGFTRSFSDNDNRELTLWPNREPFISRTHGQSSVALQGQEEEEQQQRPQDVFISTKLQVNSMRNADFDGSGAQNAFQFVPKIKAGFEGVTESGSTIRAYIYGVGDVQVNFESADGYAENSNGTTADSSSSRLMANFDEGYLCLEYHHHTGLWEITFLAGYGRPERRFVTADHKEIRRFLFGSNPYVNRLLTQADRGWTGVVEGEFQASSEVLVKLLGFFRVGMGSGLIGARFRPLRDDFFGESLALTEDTGNRACQNNVTNRVPEYLTFNRAGESINVSPCSTSDANPFSVGFNVGFDHTRGPSKFSLLGSFVGHLEPDGHEEFIHLLFMREQLSLGDRHRLTGTFGLAFMFREQEPNQFDFTNFNHMGFINYMGRVYQNAHDFEVWLGGGVSYIGAWARGDANDVDDGTVVSISQPVNADGVGSGFVDVPPQLSPADVDISLQRVQPFLMTEINYGQTSLQFYAGIQVQERGLGYSLFDDENNALIDNSENNRDVHFNHGLTLTTKF